MMKKILHLLPLFLGVATLCLVDTMEFPRSLFSDETRPDPKNFINYSSTFKTVKAVKDVVSAEVWEHVEKSPLGVIIMYVNLEFAWSSTLVHYILSRQLYCRKKHEIWFLIENQPARFSLFEFEEITGLNCGPIPNAMVVEDVEKSNSFWALFNLKRSQSTPSAADICALCRLYPDVCKSWCKEDQIRLCYLAILTGGLLGLDRREPIPPAQAKLLMDLEIFEQYPWGRVAFVELVNQIKSKTESGDIKQGSYVCKGFVQVIQVWAYAYIPCLGEAIGRPISSSGPSLLRFKGSNGKLSLGNRLQNAKVTCMCPRIMNEVHPGWEHRDEDPEVDNLLEFLSQGNSLSTITWQALPEYPLTPMISNNNRSRVASQRKSKKSKKLASREQENAGDGGENSCDIAERESDDDGNFFIQRRKTPTYEVLMIEPTDVGSLQNLIDIVDALERDYRVVKKCADLVNRVLSLEAKSRVPNIRVDGSNKEVGNEPQRAPSTIITPSIRSSARVAGMSQKKVVYGPVDKTKVIALRTFVKKKGLTNYPPGDTGRKAEDFFAAFLKPRAWLDYIHLDVPLALYRLRFSRNPSSFISPRIAIMDGLFPAYWTVKYVHWLKDQSNIPKAVYDYFDGKQPYLIPPGKRWGRDVDTIYSILMANNNHWVTMVISIPGRTIKIYDNSTGAIKKDRIIEAAHPFAHMIPYVLSSLSDDEDTQFKDTDKFSIQFVTDGVPQARHPYGNCGIYAVKFIECLVMGVPFDHKHLCDSNMEIMREKLAAEMYDETKHLEWKL